MIFLGLLSALLLASCASPPVTPTEAAELAAEGARKREEDAACLRVRTCEAYVSCRAAVAARYGVPFRGRCEP